MTPRHLTNIVGKVEFVVLQLVQAALAHQAFGVEHENLLPAFLDGFARLHLSVKKHATRHRRLSHGSAMSDAAVGLKGGKILQTRGGARPLQSIGDRRTLYHSPRQLTGCVVFYRCYVCTLILQGCTCSAGASSKVGRRPSGKNTLAS